MQSIELGSGAVGHQVVAAHVETKRQDTQTCFCCDRTWHIVTYCKARVVFDDKTRNTRGDMVFALTEKSEVARTKGAKSKKNKNLQGKAARASDASDKAQALNYAGGFVIAASDAIGIDRGDWILDSGASRNLVNYESILICLTSCVHEIAMADSNLLRLTCVGIVRLKVRARGMKMNVTPIEVYLASRLAKNKVSYGNLERKVFFFMYEGNKRAIARSSDGTVVFDSNVLYVETKATRGKHSANVPLMAALSAREMDDDAFGVHESSLLHCHQRLGHLAFDTVEHMKRGSASGIRMTSKKRKACVS
ncbi:unnamed protein product [Peronospora effusa]|nr:unnamed protein product [Peronospora effusa]